MAEDKDSALAPKMPPASNYWLDYMRGSFYKYVLTAVLPSFVFLLVVFFVSPCLSLVALPVVAVILMWLFKISNLWHQIGLGAIALVVATLMISAIFTASYNESLGGAFSDDGKLIDGKVSPFRGTTNTNFVFTVTVSVQSNASLIDAYVIVYDLFLEHPLNLTMNLVSNDTDGNTWNYSVTTTLVTPVNSYMFAADIDGIWVNSHWSDGPVSSDGLTVFGTLAWAWLVQIFGFCFMQLVVMILFLRMSSKSRDTRDRMMKDYQKKKMASAGAVEKEEAGGTTKTAGTEDTFVCSECGAEVKASAKYCPSCGEPFEEDEAEKPKI